MSTTPSPVPPAPPEASQVKLSAMQRVIGVFFSPGETFADVARVPSWVMPIVLLTILSMGVGVVMNMRVDWRSVAEKQASQSPRWEQLSAEQKNQRLDMSEKISPYIAYAIGALGPICFALIIGGAYLLLFNLFLGAGIKFKTAFSITSHAFLTGLISSPLMIIVMLMKQKGDVDPEQMLASNVGAFLSSDAPKWLAKLGGSLEIFSIWWLALLVIGFCAANPKKISRAAAIGVVFGLWGVLVLAKVIWATF